MIVYFPAPFLLPNPPPMNGLTTRTRSSGILRAPETCRRTPKMCCVESQIVSWSPSQCATDPCVSMLWCSTSGVSTASSTVTSASANPRATSPRSYASGVPPSSGPSAWTRTAPGRSAASASITWGSASYSTSIRSSASRAWSGVSAITSATSSPTYRSSGSNSELFPLYHGSFGPLAADSTRRTPDAASARAASKRVMRAWACGLRSIAPCSRPAG